jgi:hypothetical protein
MDRSHRHPLLLGVSVAPALDDGSLLVNGLAQGTHLSSGVPVSEAGWELPLHNFAGVYVYPPNEFIGVMNGVIDLLSPGNRIIDSRAVRLEWIAKADSLQPAKPAISEPNEDFAGQKVGLGIGTEVGHEVEQHKAGENQQHRCAASEVRGQGRQKQSYAAAYETQNLQRNSADDICEQDSKEYADDEQRGDVSRSSRSRDVLLDQIADAARMIFIRAHRGGQDRRSEDADAISPEVLQEPGEPRRKIVARRLVALKSDAKVALDLEPAAAWALRGASLTSLGYCGLRTRSFVHACFAQTPGGRLGLASTDTDTDTAAGRNARGIKARHGAPSQV